MSEGNSAVNALATFGLSTFGIRQAASAGRTFASMRLLTVAAAALLLMIAARGTAIADDSDAGSPMATDEQLAAVFGPMNYSMAKCEPMFRRVKITVQHYPLGNPAIAPVVHEAIRRAILFAWHNCPMQGEQMFYAGFEIDSAEIDLPGGTVAFNASNLGRGRLIDHNGEPPENSFDYQRVRFELSSFGIWRDTYGSLIWTLVILALAAVVGYLLREPLLRWYFFNFYPHPAAPMVEQALASAGNVDGKTLAASLGDMPDNPILRQVRIEQGEALVRKMQEVSQQHVRQMQKQAQETYERAALESIQEAIALAAIALARAKSLYGRPTTTGAEFS